nr:gibberellin 20 oxidase 3-like [Coffea arabica]
MDLRASNSTHSFSNMEDFFSISAKTTSIPKEYIWPKKDLVLADEELQEPVVDLQGLVRGDWEATRHAARLVRAACLKHGFFQVINHGVDSHLIRMAHHKAKAFFKLPLSEKRKGQQQLGSKWGFSVAHAHRFSTKLPWKEMLTFGFPHEGSNAVVVDFFESFFGEGFEETGLVFQRYCEAVKKLSLAIMEILGISLGIDQDYFREYFEDGNAIVRANFYPTCPEPGLTLGIGPHSDPTSVTILHQDEVGGLEVFVDNKWRSIRPRHDAFVINLGDTFMALTNGMYKSCLHRAVVKKHQERISLTYFLCPREDKMIKPPQDLISSIEDEPRKYPDFTWFDFLRYTSEHYRADETTLQNFTKWFTSFNP